MRQIKYRAVLTLAGCLALLACGSSGKNQVKVIVSKETTYITSPLLPNGLPDYMTAYIDAYSKGVTPENNAAVLLESLDSPQDLIFGVGVPISPPTTSPATQSANQIKFINFVLYGNSHWYNGPKAPEWNSFLTKMNFSHSTIGTDKPWTAHEYPLLAEWLEAQKPALEIVEKASRKSRYFCTPKDITISIMGNNYLQRKHPGRPGIIGLRSSTGEAFLQRAMFHVGQHNTAGAIADLKTHQRLVELYKQEPSLLSNLSIFMMEKEYWQTCLYLLKNEAFPSEYWEEFYLEAVKAPDLNWGVEAFNTGERYSSLNTICEFNAGYNQEILQLKIGLQIASLTSESTNPILKINMGDINQTDWNLVLKRTNQKIDQLINTTLEVDTATTQAPNKQSHFITAGLVFWPLFKDEKDRVQYVQKLEKYLRRDRSESIEQYSERIEELFWGETKLFDRFNSVLRRDRAWQRVELTALALHKYRYEQGGYPEKLDALVPGYLKSVPKDPFADKALGYERNGKGYKLSSVGLEANGNTINFEMDH